MRRDATCHDPIKVRETMIIIGDRERQIQVSDRRWYGTNLLLCFQKLKCYCVMLSDQMSSRTQPRQEDEREADRMTGMWREDNIRQSFRACDLILGDMAEVIGGGQSNNCKVG